jgi:hypothetical protein
MTEAFACNLIKASETVARLKSATMVAVLPESERQVRELRKAPVAQQAAVWEPGPSGRNAQLYYKNHATG